MRKKKVKWQTLQLKQRQRLLSWLKENELRGIEFERKLMAEDEVHICELEQGVLLKEEDTDKRFAEKPMGCMEDPYQNEEDSGGDADKRPVQSLIKNINIRVEDQQAGEMMMSESSKKAMKPFDFKANKVCDFAGFDGEEHSGNVVMKVKENEELSFQDSEERHSRSLVPRGGMQLLNTTVKDDESMSFQGMGAEHNQHLVEVNGTIVSHSAEPVIDKNREDVAFIGSQKEDEVQSLKTVGEHDNQIEEYVREEERTALSHIEGKFVIALKKTEMAIGVSQRDDEDRLLKAVVKGERNAENNGQHCDEMPEGCQKEDEHLFRESEYRSEIAVSIGRREDEYHRYGWKVKKQVRWPVVQPA